MLSGRYNSLQTKLRHVIVQYKEVWILCSWFTTVCELIQPTNSSMYIDPFCDVIGIVPREESLNSSGFIFFPGRWIRGGTTRNNRVLTAKHSDGLTSICRN